MEIRDWRAFYDSLLIQPFHGKGLPKPTAAHLDRFEAETGFRLPRSYREYIVVFGPGRLLTDWKIPAPECNPGNWRCDLQTMHEAIRPPEHWFPRHPPEVRERLLRCRYFCSKYKDVYGWDPAEVCDPDAHEYAVYHITEDCRVVRSADSFRGFVEEAARYILSLPDWDEEELGTRLLFEPEVV